MCKEKILKTGLDNLDEILGGGLVKGDLVALIARPGMGRTSLAEQIQRHIRSEGGGSLVVFSMPLEIETWKKAKEFASRLGTGPVFTFVTAPRSVERRKNKRPTYRDIERGFSKEEFEAIKFADVVVGLYRESYYDPSLGSGPSEGEASVLYDRRGHAGIAKLRFYPKKQIWKDSK